MSVIDTSATFSHSPCAALLLPHLLCHAICQQSRKSRWAASCWYAARDKRHATADVRVFTASVLPFNLLLFNWQVHMSYDFRHAMPGQPKPTSSWAKQPQRRTILMLLPPFSVALGGKCVAWPTQKYLLWHELAIFMRFLMLLIAFRVFCQFSILLFVLLLLLLVFVCLSVSRIVYNKSLS